MRVYPVMNIIKSRNYTDKSNLNNQVFKSHCPIPTSPYEIIAGSAVISGIILLTNFLITKIQKNIDNQKPECENKE